MGASYNVNAIYTDVFRAIGATRARGKLRSKKYEVFKGYRADSPLRTAEVATTAWYGLPDPGYSMPNSNMCRWLTKAAATELIEICRGLDSNVASQVAHGALETHKALREIRCDFTDKEAWRKKIDFKKAVPGVKKDPKALDIFAGFLRRGSGWLPAWMGEVSERLKRIRKRRIRVQMILLRLVEQWLAKLLFALDKQEQVRERQQGEEPDQAKVQDLAGLGVDLDP